LRFRFFHRGKTTVFPTPFSTPPNKLKFLF
jgi:hypothetical protein